MPSMISSKTYFLKSVILIANIISVCIAILPSINTLAETTQTVISITVILIELFLLLVNNIHESNVDQDILGGSKKELVKKKVHKNITNWRNHVLNCALD